MLIVAFILCKTFSKKAEMKTKTCTSGEFVKVCTSIILMCSLPSNTIQEWRSTTMMQKESSNRWDAPADIMMTEYRLELLQEYAREEGIY